MAEATTWVENLYKEWKQALDRARELEEQLKAFQKRLDLLKEIEETDKQCQGVGYKGLLDFAEKLQEALETYQNMFPCPVCGEPISWEPNDKLGQALRAFVKEKHWGHGACVNPQKK